MAIELLEGYANSKNNFIHMLSHNLESLIYVLVWICILYQAPNKIHSDRTIQQTCLKHWALAKTPNNIQALCNQKLGQLLSRSVLADFTPFFEPLKPTVTQLYKLIQHSCDPDDQAILTHTVVTGVLLDAFSMVTEVPCSAANAKRTWQCVQNEPAGTQSNYYSEDCNVHHKGPAGDAQLPMY